MKKHDQKVTIADIARMAGVSTTTVSRYLNGKFGSMSYETKALLTKIIKEYNYTPNTVARSLKTNATNLIGFVVSDIENAFAAPTIKSMNQAFLGTEYHMIVTSSDNSVEQEIRLLESLIQQRVDIILLNPVSYSATHIKEFATKVPIILIDRGIKDLSLDLVMAECTDSVREAMEHLRQEGFSELFIFSEPYLDVEPRFRRVESFKNTLINQGFLSDDINRRIITIDPKDHHDVEAKVSAIIAANQYKIPAFIAINGRTLLALAIAIKKLNLRMPYQVGLIGFDDFGLNTAYGWTELSNPAISSISPDWQQLGLQAVNVLIDRLNNPNGIKKHLKVPSHIVKRGSTKLQSKD